jgi:hypothetical protein
MTTLRDSRGARLLLAAALAWVGLVLCAQAANATYSKVTVVKKNVGGPATDTFQFHPVFMPAKADFSLKGGESNTTQVECNVSSSYGNCSKWGFPAESVTEQPATDYTLTSVDCRHTQGYSSFPSAPTDSSPADADSKVTGSKVDLKLNQWEWVRCTYTNTYVPPKGTIKLTKHVVSIPGEAGKFNLSIAPNVAYVTNVGDGGTTDVKTVGVGTYTVGETAGTGTDLADYSASTSCTDTAYGHDHTPVPGSTVVVTKGDAWECTITNTRKTAVLEVQKALV